MTISSSAPTREGGPPPIPGARLDWTGPHVHPLLVWVRTGSARAYIDGAVAFQLSAGQGALLPADGCTRRGIVTEPGTVAFPTWLDPGAGSLPEPARFEVPDGWQDWLIQLFNLHVTPFSGRGYSQDSIIDLLRRSGARAPVSMRTGDTAPSAVLALPPTPRSHGARAVAEELIRDPAQSLTVTEWATRVPSSPRTLLRDFLTDTGLTFEQWRLRCRLAAAIELLVTGYEVDQVTARVGFASRGGFTYAFKRHFGSTPYQFRRALSEHSAGDGVAGRAAAAREAKDLARLVRGADVSATAPDMLLPTRTPSHANDSHVLSWMYRGSGYLEIGSDRYERERGIATWIPADIEHTTGLREDSISLPLGDASIADLQLSAPLQVRFSPAWDDYLMFCSVAARSLLRPEGYDPRHILDLFAEQVAAQRALSVPMPTDPRAREAAMAYLRLLGLAADSDPPDVPTDIHRAFRDETG